MYGPRTAFFMADSALTQMFTQDGFAGPGQGTGNAVASAVTAPLAAAGGAINMGANLHLWSVILFLLALWGIVRVAGFRFVISTGVG